mmetsp:Transcript_110505/g.323265  ORF Transcript_110505/g.323265 Transcript_110505/m.323265 type:complete len:201 (+) Transcript_110505:775-1377(+)
MRLHVKERSQPALLQAVLKLVESWSSDMDLCLYCRGTMMMTSQHSSAMGPTVGMQWTPDGITTTLVAGLPLELHWTPERRPCEAASHHGKRHVRHQSRLKPTVLSDLVRTMNCPLQSCGDSPQRRLCHWCTNCRLPSSGQGWKAMVADLPLQPSVHRAPPWLQPRRWSAPYGLVGWRSESCAPHHAVHESRVTAMAHACC